MGALVPTAHHACAGLGSATALAALLMIAPVPAQQPTFPEIEPIDPPAAVAAEPSLEPIQVPSGGRPLVVTRADDIPPQLKAAIERAQCRLSDATISNYPVLIFRPADGRRVMAVVPCFAVTPDSRAFLFERSLALEPSPMAFPVVAMTGGFSTSLQPGLITWDEQTRTLVAWRGSDICPAPELRHIYRQGSGELNGFALSRVEHRRLRCTTPEADWQLLWQSPAWTLRP
ncbi:MAG: hypothetical protein IT536_17090 [Hyphomicrobiales bacterium]|nr:hypothetical protein [Hyphomicrobiales bacterium]